MTKRSDTEVWKALEKLTLETELDADFDAEMKAVLAMSPEERRRELLEAGFDLDKVHAQADALGAAPVQPGATPVAPVTALRPKRRPSFVIVPMAFALAAGVALVVESVLPPAPVARPHPELSPAVQAAALRKEARDACEARSWPVCLDKLNEARALDPDGDRAPEVQALWTAARAAREPQRTP
jgi:hypothetical protein